MPAAERRQALIDTAIRVFSEGSYRGTTTAEIARAAGISEPILYRHFASKRELYLAALDHVWGKARASWEHALATTPDVPPPSRRWAAGTSRCATASSRWRSSGCRRSARPPRIPSCASISGATCARCTTSSPTRSRRGQAEGVLHPDRNADAEAWTFLAGGMLGMVGRRVGLLDDEEVAAIRAARLDWLTA